MNIIVGYCRIMMNYDELWWIMAHSKWISPLLRQLPGLRWRAGPESDEVFPRTDQIGRQDSTKTVALYCLSMLHYLKIQVFEGTSRSPDRWTISSRFEKTPGSSQILCPPFFFSICFNTGIFGTRSPSFPDCHQPKFIAQHVAPGFFHSDSQKWLWT